MEFFRIVKVKSSESSIQDNLTLNKLENFSNEIFSIGDSSDHEMEIGGIWGEFTLSRKEIKGGLRFALLECPNALCWTVTTGYPPDRDAIVVHLTINREQKHQDFLDEIEEFLQDHCSCLESYFTGLKLHK